MKIIYNDILNIEEGIIVHQVNCIGVMGAGLALQIRNKYPNVYSHYKECFNKKLLELGKAFFVPIPNKNLHVVNLCGQYYYGKSGLKYTDYDAVKSGLLTINEWIHQNNITSKVYIPYGMSCGYAGGDWNIVSTLIDDVLPQSIIVKLRKIVTNEK